MNTFIIYKHTNKSNGKSYIGQTCQEAERRWRPNGNGYSDSPRFYQAIQKYGWENFTHEILETNLSQEEANKQEVYWIEYYDSFNNGYNLTPGGNNYMKTLWADPEYKKRMSEAFSTSRKNFSSEKKQAIINKMIEGVHRVWADPEWRKARIQNLTGSKNPNSKSVMNLETGYIFSTIKEAASWAGLKSVSGIGQCCRGERKTSGTHPDSGERLHWCYVDKEGVV